MAIGQKRSTVAQLVKRLTDAGKFLVSLGLAPDSVVTFVGL